MDRDRLQLWGGSLLMVVGLLALAVSLVVSPEISLVPLVGSVVVLSVGVVLVGLSRRGRAA